MLAFCVIHLILAIMLMFISVYSGFNELITVLYLGCAAMRMDFCCMFMYIICITFPFVQSFSSLGLSMQNGNYGSLWKSSGYDMFVVSALCVYYLVANIAGFMAYREWKYDLHTQRCGCKGQPGENQNVGGMNMLNAGGNNNDDD